jgi:hypothetical protein
MAVSGFNNRIFKMSEIEKEKLTREQWWHENALINHRLTWLLTAQIALFAGYGWIIEKVTLTVHDSTLYGRFVWLFPLLGLISALAFLVSIISAIREQTRIATKFPEIDFQADKWSSWGGWVAPIVTPLLFLLAWVVSL